MIFMCSLTASFIGHFYSDGKQRLNVSNKFYYMLDAPWFCSLSLYLTENSFNLCHTMATTVTQLTAQTTAWHWVCSWKQNLFKESTNPLTAALLHSNDDNTYSAPISPRLTKGCAPCSRHHLLHSNWWWSLLCSTHSYINTGLCTMQQRTSTAAQKLMMVPALQYSFLLQHRSVHHAVENINCCTETDDGPCSAVLSPTITQVCTPCSREHQLLHRNWWWSLICITQVHI